jgi:transcriptional regulator with XRE-family HTH domain
MGNAGGSRLLRRELGRKLKKARTEAQKTHEDVVAAGVASTTTMWKIESGRSAPRPGLVMELLRLYKTIPEVTDALVELAYGARTNDWWEEFGDAVPDWLGSYADLEISATKIMTYDPELIHGLLQTEDYARVVVAADGAPSTVVEQRLEFRLQRQSAVLGQGHPGRLIVALAEAVLQLTVGSCEIMTQQIAHMRDLSAESFIDIGILVGVHPWMHGPFAILEFGQDDDEGGGGGDPPVVYLESHIGARYLQPPKQVSKYQDIHRSLFERAVPIEEYQK